MLTQTFLWLLIVAQMSGDGKFILNIVMVLIYNVKGKYEIKHLDNQKLSQ